MGNSTERTCMTKRKTRIQMNLPIYVFDKIIQKLHYVGPYWTLTKQRSSPHVNHETPKILANLLAHVIPQTLQM